MEGSRLRQGVREALVEKRYGQSPRRGLRTKNDEEESSIWPRFPKAL